MSSKNQNKDLFLTPVHIEQSVIATVIAYEEEFDNIADYVRPEMFGDVQCQIIASYVWDQVEKGENLSISKAKTYIRQEGLILDFSEMIKLVDRSSLMSHCDILRKMYVTRQDIEAYEESVFNLISKKEPDQVYIELSNKLEISRRGGLIQDTRESDILQVAKTIIDIGQGKVKRGVHTGYNSVDAQIGGYKPGNQFILAARPGQGKTSWIINSLLASAMSGVPVLFFSLEMTKHEVYEKIYALLTGYSTRDFQNGRIKEKQHREDVYTAAKIMKDVPFFIEDNCGNSITSIKMTARRYRKKYGVQVVAADYLQLCKGEVKKNANKEQEVADIVKGTKVFAKKNELTWIWLSQLSRAVEARGGTKRPILSDMRDSGQIEESADVVAFIYRPDYYGIKEDADGINIQNVGELIVAKNRHGECKTLYFRTSMNLGLFQEMNGFSLDDMIITPYKPTLEGLAYMNNQFNLPMGDFIDKSLSNYSLDEEDKSALQAFNKTQDNPVSSNLFDNRRQGDEDVNF